MLKYERPKHSSYLSLIFTFIHKYLYNILWLYSFPSPQFFPLCYSSTCMFFQNRTTTTKPPKKITESDLPVTVLNIKMMSSQLHFLSFTDSSGCAFNLDTHFSLLMLSTLFISELMLQSTLCINNFLASKFLSLDLIWKFWQTERGIPKNCIEESGFCHQTPAFKFNKELAPQNLTTHSHCLSKVSSSF